MTRCVICSKEFEPSRDTQVVCDTCMDDKEPEAYPPSEVPDAEVEVVSKPVYICDCGKKFEEYYHGRNRMTRRCKDCLAKKVKRTKAEKKARGDYTRPGPKPKNGSNGTQTVLKPIKESSSIIYYALDFTGREHLKDKLAWLAFENARTPELQLVWMLIKAKQGDCDE